MYLANLDGEHSMLPTTDAVTQGVLCTIEKGCAAVLVGDNETSRFGLLPHIRIST